MATTIQTSISPGGNFNGYLHMFLWSPRWSVKSKKEKRVFVNIILIEIRQNKNTTQLFFSIILIFWWRKKLFSQTESNRCCESEGSACQRHHLSWESQHCARTPRDAFHGNTVWGPRGFKRTAGKRSGCMLASRVSGCRDQRVLKWTGLFVAGWINRLFTEFCSCVVRLRMQH